MYVILRRRAKGRRSVDDLQGAFDLPTFTVPKSSQLYVSDTMCVSISVCGVSLSLCVCVVSICVYVCGRWRVCAVRMYVCVGGVYVSIALSMCVCGVCALCSLRKVHKCTAP